MGDAGAALTAMTQADHGLGQQAVRALIEKGLEK
jgi:hypothetical protein